MDIIHSLDQMDAMLRDLAPVLLNYFNNLKNEGFTDEQALEMTKGLQHALLTGTK